VEAKEQNKQEAKKVVLNFDGAALAKIMREENHYDEYTIDEELLNLELVTTPLQTVLDAYIKDRTVDDKLSIEGVTTKYVMQKWNCDFLHALEKMDHCLNYPEDLKETKERKQKQWLKFDRDVVKWILIQENHYDKETADRAAYDLSECDSFVQPVLDAYLKDRTIVTDFNINGLTMQHIMELWDCDFWCALDKMGKLYYENPEKLKGSLDWGVRYRTMRTWGVKGYSIEYLKNRRPF
jgi:hypothetical protein